jgi:hypothetical protein
VDALVIDQEAIRTLVNAVIEDQWFVNFLLPDSAAHLKRYLLSTREDDSSRLLILRLGSSGVFEHVPNPRHAFARMLHVALMQFERTVTLPVTWKSYRQDSLLSIYALPSAKGDGQRLYFDLNPRQTSNVYVYSYSPIVADFSDVPARYEIFDKALDGYVDAVLADTNGRSSAGNFSIVLNPPLSSKFFGNFSLTEWYESRLTSEQRAFVDKDHSGPVRLRGAAGTGKTLSMAVKCLRDLYGSEDAGRSSRFAFITHSSSLAHEVLPGMFYSLDPTDRWTQLKSSQLLLGSIYELAQQLLQYERKELKPLSTDGREGREFQKLLIGDAVEICLRDTRFMNSYIPACGAEFQEYFFASLKSEEFINELVNEFASVIDAEFVRLGGQPAERYVSGDREPWQMKLPTEHERKATLYIHDQYCRMLEASRVLSMDQMIADFNRYLDTHEWRQLRDRKGFDVIFVDELHYFNRAERMVLHNLFSLRAVKSDNRVPLFMAYDLKQSTTDALLVSGRQEGAGNIFKSVGAGRSDVVELKTVFRSSPEIAAFLADLDASFPALDLEDEWSDYAPEVQADHGEIPQLRIYSNEKELIDRVFLDARSYLKSYTGRQIAILCVSEKQVDLYRKAGRIADDHIPITARDQVGDLRYAGSRVIFSMPDYVAGLQFEVVFLIDVDRAEEQVEEYGIGGRRRFISRCYLGASRASKVLKLSALGDRGGPAQVLDVPLRTKSLVKVETP